MSLIDDKRAALAGVNAEIHSFYREKLAQDAANEAQGGLRAIKAREWTVSINGVLDALKSSRGTFLQHAPVIVHGDLATAQRVVIRVAEPSLALREEEFNQILLPTGTAEERQHKQALHEEMTGRKLADVLSASNELANELGEGCVVITAPSPSTHDMPQDARDGGDSERRTNAIRHLRALESIPEFTAGSPAITLLFDNPDPQVAQNILADVAKNQGLIDEVVVVGGERLENRMVTERQVVAFPSDPLNRFDLRYVPLNGKYEKYSWVPQAKERPLIAVAEPIPVRYVSTHGPTAQPETLAEALRAPIEVNESRYVKAPPPAPAAPPPAPPSTPPPIQRPAVVVPPSPAPPPPPAPSAPPSPPRNPSPAEEPPLSPGQLEFLAELQSDGSTYVVTGVVALRLHAYAAGVDVPELFSPQGFPAMELALKPEMSNLRQGFATLHKLVKWNWIRPHPADPHPIPGVVPKPDQTASILRLRPDPIDADPLTIMVSYGTTGPDDYPKNPVEAEHRVIVGGVDVPVARLFEAAAATRRMIDRFGPEGQRGEHGQLLVDDLTQLVQKISQVNDALFAPLPGRMAPRPPGPPVSGPPTPGNPYSGGGRPGPGRT